VPGYATASRHNRRKHSPPEEKSPEKSLENAEENAEENEMKTEDSDDIESYDARHINSDKHIGYRI
ncbi:hypothetical protein L195_g051891, partial [Trifolium pratense]